MCIACEHSSTECSACHEPYILQYDEDNEGLLTCGPDWFCHYSFCLTCSGTDDLDYDSSSDDIEMVRCEKCEDGFFVFSGCESCYPCKNCEFGLEEYFEDEVDPYWEKLIQDINQWYTDNSKDESLD